MKDDIKKMVNNEIAIIKADEQKSVAREDDSSGKKTIDTAMDLVKNTKGRILEKAEKKIEDGKIIEKHADSITSVADGLMKVETERAAIEVSKRNAENKAKKQEIENRLIVLKNEAKRLRKDEKFKNKLQKLEIEKQKRDKKWEQLKSTLEPLGYNYVPNFIALNIILMLTGIKAFFNGLEKVGTAIVKCFKWLLGIFLVVAIVLIIPVTREWILELLGFIK